MCYYNAINVCNKCKESYILTRSKLVVINKSFSIFFINTGCVWM